MASPLGVYFYDAQTLTQVRFIETNVLVPSLAFSPDWSVLAVGMPDDTIWLWRTSDGARIRTLGGPDVLRGHTDWSPVTYRWPDQVPRLAFSPDGTMLASQSPLGAQNTIWLWRVSDGTLLSSLPGQVGGMLAFSPTSFEGNEEGTILASESEGGVVQLWRISTSDALATARLIRTLGPDVAGVSSFAFSPVTPGGDTGGMILAIGSINDIVRLWQTGDGVLLRTLESGERGGIGDVTFSPDGTILASAIGKTVQLWRVGDATRLHQLEGHTGSDISIAFSPDGTTLATGSTDDGTLRLWQVRDGVPLRMLEEHTGQVALMIFSPDGTLLAELSNNTVILRRASDGTILHTLQVQAGEITSMVFRSDAGEAMLVLGLGGGNVQWWRASDGSLVRTLECPVGSGQLVTLSPDGAILASWTTLRGPVQLWRVSDGSLLRTLETPDDQIRGIEFSPDGTLLALRSQYGALRLWRVSDGAILYTSEAMIPIFSMAFSLDGTMLVLAKSPGLGGFLWLQQVSDGTVLQELSWEGMDIVTDVAISPDGTLLASGSSYGLVRLWRASDGALLRTMTGHTDYIACLVFSPDGRLLASSSGDGTTRLWGVVEE